MNRILLTTAAVLAAFLLPACGAREMEVKATDQQVVLEQYNVFGTYITVVKLSDGTRCVVSDGMHSGGIDCDWRNNP